MLGSVMKKMALLFCILQSNNLFTTDIKISIRDACIGGGGLAIGAIAAIIGGNYWHPAALKREELAAAQENKRIQDQKENVAREKKEKEEQTKVEAIATFQKLKREYLPEIEALATKKSLDREQHLFIVKSKYSTTISRLADYDEKLTSDIQVLNRNSVLLSPEEKQIQSDFITKLHQIQYKYNLNLHEDKNAEKEEAKRIRHLEEEEKLKIEQERLKVKEQKLRIQVQEGKLETQKNAKQTKETVNGINYKIDTLINSQKNQEQEFAALRRLIHTSTNLLNEAVGTARAQLAALFVQRFDNAKKEVLDSQAKAQPAPQVIVQQVPPPYNPAAVSVLAATHTPSEAVDSGAMPLPTPPPSYS